MTPNNRPLWKYASFRAAATLVLALGSGLCVLAQTDAPTGPVLGNPVVWFIVDNVDKSSALFHDVMRLPFGRPDSGKAPGITPFADSGPIGVMNHIEGSQMRFGNFLAPGSPLRLDYVEYKDVDRKRTPHWNLQDSGSASLVFMVRDLDKEIAILKASNVPVIIDEEQVAPFRLASTARMAFGQDPDGFFFGLAQPKTIPATSAPADSNVVGLYLQYVVADMNHTLQVFRDTFGLKFMPTEKVAGKSGSEILRAEAVIPGGASEQQPMAYGAAAPRNVVFIDFAKGYDRKTIHNRIQDPGAPVLTFIVKDIKAVAPSLRKLGLDLVTVVNKGEPYEAPPNVFWLELHDTSNLFLELAQFAQR
jgi:hypothetical protein